MQPALSQQISKLERELDTVLFIRDHKGVQLTESGQKFRKHALFIIRQMQLARSDLGDIESDPKGTVSIGMNQANGNALAVPLYAAVERSYPNIKLDLYSGLSYAVLDWLGSGQVDISVSYEDASDQSNFRHTPLICEDLFFITSTTTELPDRTKIVENGCITFKDVSHFECMTTNPREALGHCIARYESETGIKLRKRQTFGQLMTSLEFVTQGHGHMIIPFSAFHHLLEHRNLQVFKIIEPDMVRNVNILTVHDRTLSHAASKVIEEIKKVTLELNTRGLWRGKVPAD